MRKYPRIEIDQKAYDGLQIESVLQHKTARDIATEAILSYISKEALMVISHKTTTPHRDDKTTTSGTTAAHCTAIPANGKQTGTAS